MITATSPQLASIALLHRRSHQRVWIEDDLGAMVERTGWVRSGSVTEKVDGHGRSCSLSLFRERAGESLVPLLSDAIAEGRKIEVLASTVGPDENPATGDWRPLFAGLVRRIGWGGASSEISLGAEGVWSRLEEEILEERKTYSGTLQAAMQEVLDDVFGVGVVPIYHPTDPDTTITAFAPGIVNAATALKRLSDYVGWDLRERWDDIAEEWRLVHSPPNRDQTVPDHTFGPGDYFQVDDIEFDEASVRRRVIFEWSETEDLEVVTDPAWSAGQPLRAIYLDGRQDAQVQSVAAATAFAESVFSDVSRPALTMKIDGRFFWPAEINDYYRWEGNGRHFTGNRDAAVVGFEHYWGPDSMGTRFDLRGKPTGGAGRWERRGRVLRDVSDITTVLPEFEPLPSGFITPTATAAGAISAALSPGETTNSWKAFAKIGEKPSDAEIRAAPSRSPDADEGEIGTLVTAEPGDKVYLGAFPYRFANAQGAEGHRVDAVLTFGVTEDGIHDEAVTTAKLGGGSVLAAKMSAQAQSFSSTVQFEATAPDAIEWGSFTLRVADGTETGITGGSVTNMEAITYLYWAGGGDILSTTLLSDAVADNAILFAVARPNVDGNGNASVIAHDDAVINARQINTLFLRALSADLGYARAGVIANTSENAGIFLEASDDPTAPATVPGGWARYLNLADETKPFIKHENISINQDGTIVIGDDAITLSAAGAADFSGTVTAASIIAAGDFTASDPVFKGSLTVEAGTDAPKFELETSAGNAVMFMRNAAGEAGSLSVSGGILTIQGFDGVQIEASGSVRLPGSASGTLGFYGTTPIAKASVTGSRGGNAALASLLTRLANLGLITDSTT